MEFSSAEEALTYYLSHYGNPNFYGAHDEMIAELRSELASSPLHAAMKQELRSLIENDGRSAIDKAELFLKYRIRSEEIAERYLRGLLDEAF